MSDQIGEWENAKIENGIFVKCLRNTLLCMPMSCYGLRIFKTHWHNIRKYHHIPDFFFHVTPQPE